MAEAFARMHGKGLIEPYSAGSRPSGTVHPAAIESMGELGYDMSPHQSKSLEDIPDVEFDYVVLMGCGDECPFIPGKHRADWEIPDPKTMPPDQFRGVRDQIGARVLELIEEVKG